MIVSPSKSFSTKTETFCIVVDGNVSTSNTTQNITLGPASQASAFEYTGNITITIPEPYYTEVKVILPLDSFLLKSNTNLYLSLNEENIPLISGTASSLPLFPTWTETSTFHQLPLYGIITGPSSNTIYFSSNSLYNWTLNSSTGALCQTFTLTGKNVESDVQFKKDQDPAGF